MELVCRDRMGVFNTTFFKLWTCSWCYTYLFQEHSPTFQSHGHMLAAEGHEAHSADPWSLVLPADVDAEATVRAVCGSLSQADCGRWISCCRAAERCCQEQLRHQQRQSAGSMIGTPRSDASSHQNPEVRGSTSEASSSAWRRRHSQTVQPSVVMTSSERSSQDDATYNGSGPWVLAGQRGEPPGVARGLEEGPVGVVQVSALPEEDRFPRLACPSTWDGYGCWQTTAAGQRASIACPAYIALSTPSARAYKTCVDNGSWWRDQSGLEQEWTDYTQCVQPSIDVFVTLYYIAMTCNVASLLLLVPACAIFLFFHKLRQQQRIKIHVQLFGSFVLTSVGVMLWENLVYSDRLNKPSQETLMHSHAVGCKVLYVLTRYSWTCNVAWMFLEGFHLHRLIVKAFEAPRSMLGYYITGWVGPSVPILIYVIIRAFREDSRCWVHHIGAFEWIIYTPYLLCIAINGFFLGSILRILVTQLSVHPNEPSNYRRALKATALLVPLFGLQLFLVAYKPDVSEDVKYGYEVISAIVTNSQGAVVALIFCFFNKEVLTQLKQERAGCSLCLPPGGHHDLNNGFTSHTFLTERGSGNRPGARSSPGSLRGQYLVLTAREGLKLLGNGEALAATGTGSGDERTPVLQAAGGGSDRQGHGIHGGSTFV